jgi:hypothetical protein
MLGLAGSMNLGTLSYMFAIKCNKVSVKTNRSACYRVSLNPNRKPFATLGMYRILS